MATSTSDPVRPDAAPVGRRGPLGLDPTELATCVGCGLCLPHCPTFRVTGEEGLSPRGRIDAMRNIEWRNGPIDSEFVSFMETCVQCRGCEPACPSGVPYGHLIETTKATLAAEHTITPRWQRLAFRALPRHRMLLAGSTLLAVAQRLRLVPKRAGLSRLPLRRGRLPESTAPTGTAPDVWMYTGCVMDAWLRPTHRSTASVIAATGATLAPTPARGGCCGALHVHAGLQSEAKALAERTMAAIPGDAPILVNSAGCGAAMKEYGHLLGTPAAAVFSARVRDVHEWLAEHADRLPPPQRSLGSIIVQDPCHLRHVQKAQQPLRTVLARYADIVELDDDGLCCGAGGAYSVLQPELGSAIRERKVGVIDQARARSGATVVASANPGCAMHLAAAGLDVRHPMDLVADAIGAGS